MDHFIIIIHLHTDQDMFGEISASSEDPVSYKPLPILNNPSATRELQRAKLTATEGETGQRDDMPRSGET